MADMKEARADSVSRDVETGSSNEGTIETAKGFEDALETPKIAPSFWQKLSFAGVEMRGAEPVPVEKRTDTQYINVFTIFATSMTSLLP